ncbi:MAG TPA: TetR/AcrR family transcriptional regulator [Clostridiales bacterium]|jgi:AcrR family transcriptional regulator|nr:TetR/AcrR family transcriptional regulator [Clostridiales bacterium]
MKRGFDYSSLIGSGNPLKSYPQLYEAAVNEFSMKKHEEASLNDILKNSGMSKGSFYYHFGDKFGLYLAMMDIITNKKLSYFYPAVQERAGESGFFDTLKDIMKGTMDFMLADERLYHLLNRVLEEDESLRSRMAEFFPYDNERFFSEYIKRAKESGEIDSSCDEDFIAKLIMIIFSNIHKLIENKTPNELLKTANQVLDIIRFGISRSAEGE